MTEKITFLHAADLHLDSSFQGFAKAPHTIFEEVKESTFRALENLIQTAIDYKVDFVLLVGDLFDHERQSLKAQIQLRKAFEQLQTYGIPVYICYGNHDYVKGNIYPVKYPENVFIFKKDYVTQHVYEKNGKPLVAIQGFSYHERSVRERKVDEYEVKDDHIPYHIAMLHGNYQGNQTHDMYAPFLIEELARKPFDYWALGHIHERKILKKNPLIVYPGNTQGRHRKEQGEKGCYIVQLSKNDANLTFVPLQAIQFLSLEIDLISCQDLHEVEKLIEKTYDEKNLTLNPYLIDLTFRVNHSLHRKWALHGLFDELIEMMNDFHMRKREWKYIYQYRLVEVENLIEPSVGKNHFLQELKKQYEEETIDQFLEELFMHREGRKFLNELSEKDKRRIQEQAYHLLMDHLYQDGER